VLALAILSVVVLQGREQSEVTRLPWWPRTVDRPAAW
jgi:hypothetical protein